MIEFLLFPTEEQVEIYSFIFLSDSYTNFFDEMIDPIKDKWYVSYHNCTEKEELKMLTQVNYIHQLSNSSFLLFYSPLKDWLAI